MRTGPHEMRPLSPLENSQCDVCLCLVTAGQPYLLESTLIRGEATGCFWSYKVIHTECLDRPEAMSLVAI